MSDKTQTYLAVGALALGGYVFYKKYSSNSNHVEDIRPPYVESQPTTEPSFTTKPEGARPHLPWSKPIFFNLPQRPMKVPENPAQYHNTDQFLGKHFAFDFSSLRQ
jgi:hypothetical protein